MKDLERVSQLVERYTMEARIKAFHTMFTNKNMSDAKSDDFIVDKTIVDSLKNAIAISFYALTAPVTEKSAKTDFLKLERKLVILINSFSKTNIQKNYQRGNSDIFLDASFAMSNSNLEYISAWQWIEFFEFFDDTIASLFKVKSTSRLIKYVIANEGNNEISLETFERGVMSLVTDEETKKLEENSWELQELTREMRNVESVQDAYNVLRKKLLPMVFYKGHLLYAPNQHGSFQITMEYMFLTQQNKALKRIQTKFEDYVVEIISKELTRIDPEVKIQPNYYVEIDGQEAEQDLLLQSDGFNWVVEIKASRINLGLSNVLHARKKLQTTYDKYAVKASQQISRAVQAIQNGEKIFTRVGKDKVNVDIMEPIRGIIGVTVTLWNFSLLAHQQGLFLYEEHDVYPILTVFDFQYLLKSISTTSDYANLLNYFQYRLDNSEQIVAVDFDELNFYDVYEHDSGVELPSGQIIIGSKTPGIVSYVDDKIKPQLYAKISPFVAHRLDY